jgi:uncharacterized protein YkwD
MIRGVSPRASNAPVAAQVLDAGKNGEPRARRPSATYLVRGRTIVRAITALLVGVALTLARACRGSARAQAPCAGSGAPPSAATLDIAAGAVLCLVNRHRTSHGRPALSDNDDLVRSARRHSRDMVRRAFFAHMTPTGSSPTDRMRRSGYIHGVGSWAIGEDIGWGTGSLSTPAATVAAWIASPEHNRVLLHGDFRAAGVGIAVGVPVTSSGRFSGATYTLDVGASGG